MWQFINYDPGCDPFAVNPTPMKNVLDPHCGAVCLARGTSGDPGALTCMVFDPMVHHDQAEFSGTDFWFLDSSQKAVKFVL
jgi:hypothetical protein